MKANGIEITDFFRFPCPRWPKVGSSWSHVCSNLRKNGASMLQVDFKLVQIGSKTIQIGSKLAHVGSKFSPRSFKFAQVGPSWRQSGPRTGQVGGKTATSTQDGRSRHQDRPNEAQPGSRWASVMINLAPRMHYS